MNIKNYNYGDYFQKIFIKDGKILDVSCTCLWAKNNPKAFREGNTICKHIICAMKEYDLEMWNKNKIEKKIKGGYVFIYKPDHKYSKTKQGWIFEHRSVVEDFLKRGLKGECIHHIDENKQNNKIENLMLFKSNKEHSSFHTKIRQFGMTNPIKRQIENRWENIK